MRIKGNDHRQKIMTLAVSNKGFTLIELAIVLIIIGILLGMGAGLLGSLTKRAKYNESEDIVKSAIEAVLSYGASRNKLPVTGDFASTLSIPNDAYTKSLFYIVDSNLTDTTIGGICGRKTTNLTVKVCPDLTCSSPTDTINNVGFIVLSGAGNYNNQTAGTEAFSSAKTIKVFESDYDVDNYTTDMNRSEAYDDIVDWVAINELKAKVNCGPGTALKIINNSLPDGWGGCANTTAYSATVFAEGGVPYSSGGDYKWCRQESASSGLTFTPSTLNTDCLNLAEGSWGQADEIVISGTATAEGTFRFTFFVRDNNDSSGSDDNIDQRKYVLTLNTAAAACSTVRVYSAESSTVDYYDSVRGRCREEDPDKEIENGMTACGDYIERYNGNGDNCNGAVQETFTFIQALAADTDGDCKVFFDGTDR